MDVKQALDRLAELHAKCPSRQWRVYQMHRRYHIQGYDPRRFWYYVASDVSDANDASAIAASHNAMEALLEIARAAEAMLEADDGEPLTLATWALEKALAALPRAVEEGT